MKDVRLVTGNKNYSSWSLCPWLLLKMFDIEFEEIQIALYQDNTCLLYTSPSPRDRTRSRMPSSA